MWRQGTFIFFESLMLCYIINFVLYNYKFFFVDFLLAILLFIGLSLYNAMSMSHLEYSFYLAIVGVVILFIVFIISFMNYYQTLKHSKKGQPKPYIDLALENRLIVTSTSRDLIREEDSSLSRL